MKYQSKILLMTWIEPFYKAVLLKLTLLWRQRQPHVEHEEGFQQSDRIKSIDNGAKVRFFRPPRARTLVSRVVNTPSVSERPHLLPSIPTRWLVILRLRLL